MRFNITVCRVSRVYGCPEKLAQEARGCFGFHLFERCPNCKLVFEGWEGWGSNGHLQFSAKDRKQLTGIMRNLVRRSLHSTIPIHFQRGNAVIYYRGN